MRRQIGPGFWGNVANALGALADGPLRHEHEFAAVVLRGLAREIGTLEHGIEKVLLKLDQFPQTVSIHSVLASQFHHSRAVVLDPRSPFERSVAGEMLPAAIRFDIRYQASV